MKNLTIQLGELYVESSISVEEWEAMEPILQRTKLSEALDDFKREKITQLRLEIVEGKDGRIVEGYIQALEDLADLIESGIHNSLESEKANISGR